VKVETIRNRMVTLFFIEGIDIDAVRRKPDSRKEVQELQWKSIEDYVKETMKQNSVENVLGQVSPPPKYCAYYVKSFAYFVSEWQTLRRMGKLGTTEGHQRISIHD